MADTGTAWATGKYEWLDSNRSKAYPLADTTGGEPGTLPPSLLVDACILSDTPDVRDVYISKIEVSDVGWMLSITAYYPGGVATFDRVISVAFSSSKNSEAKNLVSSPNGDLNLAVSFTIGDPAAVRDWPAVNKLSLTNGLLSPSTVHDIAGMFITSIRVGSSVLTGSIELIAGDGIDLTVSENKGTGWQIEIANKKYSVPTDNTSITSDDSLLTQITSTYGTPVTTINGVPPSNGNINIATPESESSDTQYVVPTSTGTGTISLSLSKNPNVDLSTIENLAENLEQLSLRAIRLDEGVKALDRGLNALATQMTRLDK